MKSLKITALSLVLVLLLAACGAKNDTPDEPAVDPTPEPPIEQPVEKTPDERINDIIARRGTPAWLEVEGEKLKGKVIALPTREDVQFPINEQLIVELYSK